ncbi:MAG: S-layer homology domain-containing protein [Oscillospiraceae bacterium]|nr:S-layer homology domain-containing protein [Oscillospiraceae bacterium]
MKKLLSILLCLTLVVGLLPTIAFAVELDRVEITITAPKVGEHPSFAATVGDGYRINSDSLDVPGGIVWFDLTQERELKSSDMFQEGHEYVLGIALKTIDENIFKYASDRTTVLADVFLNGSPVEAIAPPQDAVKGGRTVIAVRKNYFFPKYQESSTQTPIDTVAVYNLVPPIAGQTWDSSAVVGDDEPYTVNGLAEWYDETDKKFLPMNATFQEGHVYTVIVRLDAKDGYAFASTATDYRMEGTLNGMEAKLSKDFEYQRWARVVVSYTFPAVTVGKKITRISISDVIPPKIGRQSIAREQYLKYSEGVEGIQASWYENNDYNNRFTGVFASNKQYMFEVVLKPKEGYEFARKSTGAFDVVVTFNGVVVGQVSDDGMGNLSARMDYGNLGAEKERIKGVVSYKIKEPVVGETPSFTAENQREDGLYYIDTPDPNSTKNGITWYEGVGDARKMAPTDTFQAGEYYYVAIRVKPIDGYWFDTDSSGDLLVSGAINQNTSVISGDEESLFVGYTFEKTEEAKTEPEQVPETPTQPEQVPETPTQPEQTVAFTDVDASAYYYRPVLWAVEQGITSGTSATTFSPNQNCNRGQVVTFLWRMVGSPEPAAITNPFVDVAQSMYYCKPVLWAYGSKITGGTSATMFSPNLACTRGQVVTFLWRTAGQPKVEVNNPFTDVDAGAYYADAVLWAVEQGITSGTSATTFSPDATCTRGQVVTFLYRFIN